MPDPFEPLPGLRAISQQHTFRDLENKRLRRQVVTLEQGFHRVQRQAAKHLGAGQIDRQGDFQAHLAPAFESPAGLFEYPGANFTDQPRLFGQWNELAWRHHAAPRMKPAQQRLGPHQTAGRNFQDRLKMQRQLSPFQSLAQVDFQQKLPG